MTQPQPFQDIAENLSFLDDWEDRYRYLIELGQALPKLEPQERTDTTKVNGCVSQVWLVTEPVEKDGAIALHLKGESDAMIVQGLVAILLALYSDRPAKEVAETDAVALFDELGLREHLTAQRSNGLVAMVNRIRGDARALAV
jgi:cysteine desulfuration protein SufE